MEKDHLFLSIILIDSSKNDTIRGNLGGPTRQKLSTEDEFNNGLERLRKAGEISIWIVHASRIILDIHDLLGKDVERGYDNLRSATQAALKVLDLQVKGNELVPGGNGECWHARDADLPARIYNFLKFWVVSASLPSLKASYLQQRSCQPTVIDELPQDVREQALKEMLATGFGFHNDDVLPEQNVTLEKMDLKIMKPDKDSNFLYANNPLYGGTLKFSLAFNMEKAGITLANHQLVDLCNGASLQQLPAKENHSRRMARAGQDHTAPHWSAFRRSITDDTIRMPHSSLAANGSYSKCICAESERKSVQEH